MNEEKEKKENGDYKFVYFIDTHEKTKKFKIYLSDEYEGKNTLEVITEKEIKKELNELSSEVYRFKIIPDSLKKDEEQNYQILILGEEDGKNYQYRIKFNDATKDIYEYDFNIEQIDFQPLSHEEQFEIYVEIVRKIYKKKMDTPENENLIISTHKLFDGKEKKCNFFFYILIFLECYRSNQIQQHLLKFKPEKIEGLGNFPEKKLNSIKAILKMLSKNPSQALNLKNSKDEVELIQLFYSILLYFNMNFQKEKVEEMFNDDKILTYLSKKLISFHNLYKGLILPKHAVRKLIQKSKTFDEILGFLPYIGNDIIELLKLIYSEFDLIKTLYENEFEKIKEENENKEQKDKIEMKKLEVDKFVIPKKSDNIEELRNVVSLIIDSEKMAKKNIIKFSKSLITQYIGFYNGRDLKNLELINNIITKIKGIDKDFEIKYDDKEINSIIHETGLELIKRKEMKNNEILDFIKSDDYFNKTEFNKVNYRPIEVLDGIDIEALDGEFFKKWIAINFNVIFNNSLNLFYEKIASLIKDMKHFGLLYKFFLIYNSKEYKNEILQIMKKKYIELLPISNIEKCPNFVEDTIKLISLFNEKKIGAKNLLESIQNNLDFEKVNVLYIKLKIKNYMMIQRKQLLAISRQIKII